MAKKPDVTEAAVTLNQSALVAEVTKARTQTQRLITEFGTRNRLQAAQLANIGQLVEAAVRERVAAESQRIGRALASTLVQV